MTEQKEISQSTEEDKPKLKPGPKPKQKIDWEKEFMALKQRYERAEKLLLEITLHTGHNPLAKKNGFTPLVANAQKKWSNQ